MRTRDGDSFDAWLEKELTQASAEAGPHPLPSQARYQAAAQPNRFSKLVHASGPLASTRVATATAAALVVLVAVVLSHSAFPPANQAPGADGSPATSSGAVPTAQPSTSPGAGDAGDGNSSGGGAPNGNQAGGGPGSKPHKPHDPV